MGGTSTNPKPFGKGAVWFLLMVVGGVLVCAAGLLAAPQSSKQVHRPQSCEILVNNEDLPTDASYINFDDLPEGTFLTNQYQAAYGVVFVTSAQSYPNIHADEAMANSVPNYVDNYAGGYFSNNVPMTITFDTPQEYVALYFGHGVTGMTGNLVAYDVIGNVLCQADMDPIPDPIYGFVGVRNLEGEIAYVTIDYGDTSYSEAIDDLYFAPLVTDTPTPTATQPASTNTPTRTASPTRTRTATPTRTRTATPTAFFTNTPTSTSKDVSTNTPTSTSTSTCPVAFWGYPASLDAGNSAVITWDVLGNTYFSTETYLAYDWTSHPAEGPYPYYQRPYPNSGQSRYQVGIPAPNAGTLYVRPALRYQEVKGAEPQLCLGNYEVSITVNYVPPPPTPPKRTLSGYVYNRKGAPLANVQVKACRGLVCQGTTTNAWGAYQITGLEEGLYQVEASLAGFVSQQALVRLPSAVSINFTLLLIPTPTPTPVGGTYNGHVAEQRAGHAAIAGARLQLRPLSAGLTYLADATSDASGNYTFTHVPPGQYVIFAIHTDYYTWFAGFPSVEGGTVTGEIQMRWRYTPPTGVPSSAVDLTVSNIMVSQAIQRWDNSVHLAAGHVTEVRAFIDLGGASSLPSPNVWGYLTADCIPGRLEPLAEAQPRAVSNWNSPTSRRSVVADVNASLNFRLPAACTSAGTRTFTVTVHPTYENRERSVTNNSRPVTVTFYQRRIYAISLEPVSLRAGTFCPGSYMGPPPPAQIPWSLEYLYRLHPTVVHVSIRSPQDFCASPRTDTFPYDVLPGWWYINSFLWIQNIYMLVPSTPGFIFGGPVPTVLGLLNGAECAGEQCHGGAWGQAFYIGHGWNAAALSRQGPETTDYKTTPAHELAHVRGIDHSGNSHGESGGGSWVAWPYPHGAFSVAGANEAWGFETRYNSSGVLVSTVFAPVDTSVPNWQDYSHTHDLMSYGQPRWISVENWENLFYSYRPPSAEELESSGPAATPQRYLMVTGINQGTSLGDIQVMRPISMTASVAEQYSSLTDGTVTYTLRLADIGGNTLSSVNFSPYILEGDKVESFQVLVPWPVGAAFIDVISGTQVLTTTMISSQPPTVTILSPNTGTFTDTLTLTWQGSDPDGQPLTYDIYYSPDGGVNWTGVSVFETGTSIDVDLTYLAGGETAVFKVVASDGVNTAEDYTDAPLIIPRRAPTAVINSPVSGLQFNYDTVVSLEGDFQDFEETELADANFVWTSDVDGVIAYGKNAIVNVLSVGHHVITLTVTDSDGMSGSASVDVWVGVQLYIPMVKR